MILISSEKCLKYHSPGHPETPFRVRTTIDRLKDRYEIVSPKEIDQTDLERVHSAALIDQVRSGSFLDPDTPAYPDIYSLARLSAGAAVKAAELALAGEPAMSLMRPPGHHAGRDQLGGFCYFNNVAVATAGALTKVKRAAIVDFDCHHGNGTQEIFLNDERVWFLSLHQSPLYPGTGLSSNANCHNYPLPARTTGGMFVQVLHNALSEIELFSPNLIAVSAGFDAYKNDPITDMGLDLHSFEQIGREIAALGLPRFAVLEGGYAPDLAECVERFLVGFDD